jgi:uncharacterized iron-regulated protein
MRPRPLARTALAAVLPLALACAGHPVPRPPFGEDAWASPLNRKHPLVGKIWDARERTYVDAAALGAAAGAADLVYLGETHDNRDHHAMEAALVRALVVAGRRPALAFEMINADRQGDLDRALAEKPPTADGVAQAIQWSKSGWPDFAFYRPVFAAGIDGGLAIVATNLSRDLAHDIVKDGAAALPPPVRARIDREGPLPPEVARRLRDEIAADHCGLLPEDLLDPMVLAQRARDAQIAGRILEADAAGQGVVLVAGSGHTRIDRGVPAIVARDAPRRRQVSVALLEAVPGRLEPDAYAADYGVKQLPFDFAVFTPGAERGDPCEGMRHPPKRTPAPSSTPAAAAPAPAAPGAPAPAAAAPAPPAPGAGTGPAPGASPGPGR